MSDIYGWNENAFFHFRENAKIMQKWADFREISFRENFRFRKNFCKNLTKFSFSRKFSRKSDEIFAKTKIFAKMVAKI
jgi:hypothetical protein